MEKDFDRWNEIKKALEDRPPDLLFHQGEIWWCSVGLNVAIESCGKGPQFRRPVLIIRKLSRKAFIGIPLSTQPKIGTWFTAITVHNQPGTALLYQIRLFSANRLQRRLATLEPRELNPIRKKLKSLLEL